MFGVRQFIRNCTYQKSCFWSLAKNHSVGFIKSTYKKGLILPTEYVLFYENLSMHSNGNVIKLSIEKLSHQYKDGLASILSRKIPVYVEYSNHLIGMPTKGNIINPYYANLIIPLPQDVSHIKNLTYHLR